MAADARGVGAAPAEGALISQLNYNLFDLEVMAQQASSPALQAKDLARLADGLAADVHDVALWNGKRYVDSVHRTTLQYFGVIDIRLWPVETNTTIGNRAPRAIVDGIKGNDRTTWQRIHRPAVRPTAIYSNLGCWT